MIAFLLAVLPNAATSSTRCESAREKSYDARSTRRENSRDGRENLHALDDARVVAHCLEADDEAARLEAFGVLLHRHRDRILNLAWQMTGSRDDAEDASQEAFLLAFRGLPTFRGDAQFGTWIYRIAINVCLAKKRRAKTTEEWNDELHLVDQRGEFSSDAASCAEKRLQVAQTLDALSPTLRAVLVLREIHDLSYEEIARVLSVPIGTVRSRLSEARRKFIALWSEA